MTGRPISYWDNSDRVDMLERLFAEGIRIVEIARCMGHTRNAIIGRLWRTGMSRREVLTITMAERLAALSVFPLYRHCLWPYGDPGTLGFHFCGELSRVGSSYCAMHAKQAGERASEHKRRLEE